MKKRARVFKKTIRCTTNIELKQESCKFRAKQFYHTGKVWKMGKLYIIQLEN